MRIPIRDITRLDLSEVIRLYHEREGEFEVEFDNGTLIMAGAEIVFTRIVMNYWLALPVEIPLKMEYSIACKRELTPHTPCALCTLMYRDYLDKFEFTEHDIDDRHMNHVVYRDIINVFYNFCVDYLDAYVEGANSFDFIEILEHPPIREANRKIQQQKHDPTPEELAAVHKLIADETLKSPELKHNSFAIALRCKAIKMQQFVMMVGPIGYCTDIDSSLFPHPLRCGFYEGNAKLWEFGIESRNASIASLYNELIMPESQYANRRYQLFAAGVRWVVRQDCGTRKYKDTLITNKQKLKSMEGIWRYEEATGSLVPIKATDDHLIGKTIKHRSIFYCDWNASRSEVCAICYGRLYRAAMKFAKNSQSNAKGNNIGQIAAVQVGAANSSQVLGRKHANSTSVASKFLLNIEQSAYMHVSEDGKYLLLNKDLPLNKIRVTLYKEQAERLHDVKSGMLKIVSPAAITAIEDFELTDLNRDEGFNSTHVLVGSKQRNGYLSYDALEYVKQHGWGYDEHRDFVVDMSHWDVLKPFIHVPQIEFSPPEFIDEVTSFLLGPSSINKGKSDVIVRRLDSYGNPMDATDAFFEEIQEHLDVHYSHLSVLVLSLSAQDPANDDYRLPYPRYKGVIVTDTPLMNNNSLGMSMAYEEQHKILAAPQTFVLHKRRGHPLDGLLLSKVYGNLKKV